MLGCVTHQRLQVSTNWIATNPLTSVYLQQPVSLRAQDGGPSGLFLDITCRLEWIHDASSDVHAQGSVRFLMYEFRLLDRRHTELLVYHWQPGQAYRGPDEAHIHVSASLNAWINAVAQQQIALDTLHVATGHVSFADVVRSLVTEFRITPQRRDWETLLSQAKETFNSNIQF